MKHCKTLMYNDLQRIYPLNSFTYKFKPFKKNLFIKKAPS